MKKILALLATKKFWVEFLIMTFGMMITACAVYYFLVPSKLIIGTISGLSIVISGVFTHHSRDEYKAMIELHGGKNVGSISAKTSFVLAGDNMGPAKLEKAQKLGVRIVSEDEFLTMIQ